VRIDHVIYAAVDLDAVVARIEDELGLTTVAGGRHEGHGTHNRIVPLGGGYLEILGLADPQEAANSEFGRGLLTRLARDGEGWLAWVVAVQDIDPVARRLGTAITTLARRVVLDRHKRHEMLHRASVERGLSVSRRVCHHPHAPAHPGEPARFGRRSRRRSPRRILVVGQRRRAHGVLVAERGRVLTGLVA
jgi:Glyoxalase-like domain